MRSSLNVVALGILCGWLVGCGDQSGDPAPIAGAQEEDAQPAPDNSSNVLPSETPPNEVVSSFLNALKSGDNTTAEQLLTGKARVETAKFDLAVRPPGTPSAQYEIGGVDYVDDQEKGAHVTSVWSEFGPDGEQVSYEVIWALRRQDNGWRVAGMATEIFDHHPPVFFNFEDPEDMLRKLQQADELANSQQPPDQESVRQASYPETQPSAVR